MADAVDIFAHYDARPPENNRAAKQRARSRIRFSVAKGMLTQAPDKSFLADEFVAWATSLNKAMQGKFPGFKESEYISRINGKLVAYRPGVSVVMEPLTDIDDANKQAVVDKLTIKLLEEELARYRALEQEVHHRMSKARQFKKIRQHGK